MGRDKIIKAALGCGGPGMTALGSGGPRSIFTGFFAPELVAFANTSGGRILLGVRDDGRVKGIADTNELRARIQDIARNCDPPVKILLKRIDKVTVVTVRESDPKPVQCSEGFFWRQGAVTQKLSREEIRDLFQQAGAIRCNEEKLALFDLLTKPQIELSNTDRA